ncbi:MAG: hypothetical protein HDT23_05100 [Ruminococcus sp.]|nr:hypothetical protein [Ruminococcus sp.]
MTNLSNADKLNSIIYQLKCIEYYNDPITSSYIPNPEDKKAFEDNPQNYEWKFRIIPSY